MTGEAGRPFEKAAFSGRKDSIRLFLDAALARMPESDALRVLDLGCGAGDLLLAVRRYRPRASLTGVDISPLNIQAAVARAKADPYGLESVTFEAADYLRAQFETFGVILAESVLHLIADDHDGLAAKLAADLAPGGLLIATMPQDNLTNRILIGQRRLWRAMPPAADSLAVKIARTIHPTEPAHIIAERVRYLRIIPERLHGPQWIRQMQMAGLDLVEDSNWPRATILKPIHRLLVFKRQMSAGEN
ncbi:class I SAM-dependent methyltransferase [Bradyrhizobium sp. USDA 3650]